jgi:hypothetical protein
MADFTDGYLYQYRNMLHVFTGTLQPQNAPVGVGGPFTGVQYRLVETDEEETDDQEPNGGTLAETQTFEIWTITLNAGGYNPKPGDIFIDVDSKKWAVVKQDKGDLVSSSRIRPTISLFCRRIQ